MIWGLDTNIVVRFLVKDDEAQAQRVYALFKKIEKNREKAYLSLLVIQETIWVLESAYHYKRDNIIDAIKDFKELSFIKCESEEVIIKFLEDAEKSSCDLSDLLIAHILKSNGCDKAYTFDKKASKHAFFELLG